MNWFGVSNARPTASVTPWFGTYSPTWVGNTNDPATPLFRAALASGSSD